MKSTQNDVEEARKELISLYLGIKLRKESDVINCIIYLIQALAITEDDYNKEIEDLKNISLLYIVNYVKNSIDVIVTFKVEDLIDDYKSNKNQNAAADYETLLQKEEAAIRQHISYEHQIKIEYEKVLEKIEVLELENKLLVYQLVSK